MNQRKKSERKRWLEIAIAVSVAVLLLVGFIISDSINSFDVEQCKANPLTYGIKEMNDWNRANFTCMCMAKGQQSKIFNFDESGIYIPD